MWRLCFQEQYKNKNMITSDNKLRIFENFVVDRNLPKFKKDKKSSLDPSISFGSRTSMTSEEFEGNMEEPSEFSFNNGVVFLNDQSGSVSGTKANTSFIDSITLFFVKRFFRKNKMVSAKGKMIKEATTVDRYDLIKQFFASAGSSLKQLKSYDKVAESYNEALIQAEDAGQTALFEKLKDKLYIIKGETTLIQNKLTKYLSEDMVVDFYNATEKDEALKLSWIKNYTRLIPSNVIEIKKKLDEKEVFDNYAILHFDPNNEAVDLTQEEKEKIKDPILFGVMNNSRKLYYVADWIDEVCDLTLDKVLETLGKEAFEINDKTVKSYINEN